MKKPDPISALDKASMEEWVRSDTSEEDRALQDMKDDLRRQHAKQRAKQVMEVMKATCTKRQIEIFLVFVETGSIRETARKFDIFANAVQETVDKVRRRVIENELIES